MILLSYTQKKQLPRAILPLHRKKNVKKTMKKKKEKKYKTEEKR